MPKRQAPGKAVPARSKACLGRLGRARPPADKGQEQNDRQAPVTPERSVKSELSRGPVADRGAPILQPRSQSPGLNLGTWVDIRVAYIVAACRSFQTLKQTWSLARACCLANAFMDPPLPPEGDGTACYHRLTLEQRQRFRAYVEASMQPGSRLDGPPIQEELLHPEMFNRSSKRRRTSTFSSTSARSSTAALEPTNHAGLTAPEAATLAGMRSHQKRQQPRSSMAALEPTSHAGLTAPEAATLAGMRSHQKRQQQQQQQQQQPPPQTQTQRVPTQQNDKKLALEKLDDPSSKAAGCREDRRNFQSSLGLAHLESGVPGVNWDRRCWRVRYRNEQRRFHPKNNTPLELENSRVEAVRCLQRLQLKGKTARSMRRSADQQGSRGKSQEPGKATSASSGSTTKEAAAASSGSSKKAAEASSSSSSAKTAPAKPLLPQKPAPAAIAGGRKSAGSEKPGRPRKSAAEPEASAGQEELSEDQNKCLDKSESGRRSVELKLCRHNMEAKKTQGHIVLFDPKDPDQPLLCKACGKRWKLARLTALPKRCEGKPGKKAAR